MQVVDDTDCLHTRNVKEYRLWIQIFFIVCQGSRATLILALMGLTPSVRYYPLTDQPKNTPFELSCFVGECKNGRLMIKHINRLLQCCAVYILHSWICNKYCDQHSCILLMLSIKQRVSYIYKKIKYVTALVIDSRKHSICK